MINFKLLLYFEVVHQLFEYNKINICLFSAKTRLHMLMQQDRTFTPEDRAAINPCSSVSIDLALDFVKNPVKCCEKVHTLIQRLMSIVRLKRDDPKTKG